MKKNASEFYRSRRGNCAQAVHAGWQSAGSPGDCGQLDFSSCGHGRAPEGICGALHAACEIAGTEAGGHIKARFSEMTGGHVTCRSIRTNRAASCIECVEKVAEILEEELCAVPV